MSGGVSPRPGEILTARNAGPYHFRGVTLIRRSILIAAVAQVIAFAGCASAPQPLVRDEVGTLRAELRALRAQNAELERRLSRVEDAQAVSRSRAQSPPPRAEASAQAEAEPMPKLSVVKLQPKAKVAPRLPVVADVQEPDEDTLEAMLRADDRDVDPKPSPQVQAHIGAALFEEGLASLKTGNVAGAVHKLQAFVVDHPRHADADNALYYSGVGLLALGDLQGAAAAFERVLSEYPAGDARMESMLRLADCRLKQNQHQQARDLYARLINTFPGTTAANEARERLGKITQ
jgi:tol-pal system protein YbgF